MLARQRPEQPASQAGCPTRCTAHGSACMPGRPRVGPAILCNTPRASARRARFVRLTHRARASLTPSSALSCGTDSFCSSPTSSSAASAQPADVDVLALEAGGCMSSVLAGDRRISIAFVDLCAAVTLRSAQVVRVAHVLMSENIYWGVPACYEAYDACHVHSMCALFISH